MTTPTTIIMKTAAMDFLLIFSRVLAVVSAIGVVVFVFIQAYAAYSLGRPESEPREDQTVGFIWYCDGGALLYPNGPHSTPICVAYTPARKL